MHNFVLMQKKVFTMNAFNDLFVLVTQQQLRKIRGKCAVQCFVSKPRNNETQMNEPLDIRWKCAYATEFSIGPTYCVVNDGFK